MLVLRDIEELSTQEVADMLSMTQTAVKVRLHRARQALSTLLRREFAPRAVTSSRFHHRSGRTCRSIPSRFRTRTSCLAPSRVERWAPAVPGYWLDTYRQRARTLGSSASQPFDARAMAALGISVVCSTEESRHVPSTGPLVVAANHPHGLLDGLALLQVIRHTPRRAYADQPRVVAGS